MSQKDQLIIPDAAIKDPKSTEVARVWVAAGGQHVSLRPTAWKDPAAWGIVLADLARHLANAYNQELGYDKADCLRRIKVMLDAELDSPTDNPSGKLVT